MKRILFGAAALLTMISCSKEKQETRYGYISLGVSADTEIVVTKGMDSQADLSGYNITLTRDGVHQWTKEYETLKESDLIVSAGSYSIYVENLTDAEAHSAGMGSVRVAGSADVTVIGDAVTECTVDCKPVNSKISCIYTENFKVVYGNTAVVTLDASGRNLNMDMTPYVEVGEQTYGSEAYFAADELVAWELNASVLGIAKRYSGSFTTMKNRHTVVKFDAANTGMISISVTVDDEISQVEELDVPIDPLKDF